jgi:Lrp/AsnC family leucine-responsive transcriptional regulator
LSGVWGEDGQAYEGKTNRAVPFSQPQVSRQFARLKTWWKLEIASLRPASVITPNHMDSIDFEILSLIQNDARAAHATVGERLGLTAPAVHARIKRLERDGIIRGYLTAIDPIAVNQTLLVFVRVTTNSKRGDEDKFENFVRQQANILECHDISGEDSYLLKIRVESPTSLRQLLYRIRDFPGVERTVTSISLCTIKELGGPPLTAPVSESESSVQSAQR